MAGTFKTLPYHHIPVGRNYAVPLDRTPDYISVTSGTDSVWIQL